MSTLSDIESDKSELRAWQIVSLCRSLGVTADYVLSVSTDHDAELLEMLGMIQLLPNRYREKVFREIQFLYAEARRGK